LVRYWHSRPKSCHSAFCPPRLCSNYYDPVVPGDNVTTTDNYDDDGFDWGWLGLLGLIGLAGLKGKDRDRDTRTSYDDRTTTPSINNPSTTTTNNPRY